MSFLSSNHINDVLIYGKFDKKNLRISYSSKSLNRSSVICDYIEKVWNLKTRKNSSLFPGNITHVKNVQINKKSISIKAIHSTYDDYLVTRSQKFFKKFPDEEPCNPLSVGALIRTLDGKLILGIRNDNVATHKHSVSIPSGMIDENDILDGHKIDAFSAVFREIFEEIFLSVDEISTIFCMGLIINRKNHQTFLPFFCQTKLNTDQIKKKFNIHKMNSEFSSIFAIPMQSDFRKELCGMKMSDILPPTLEVFSKTFLDNT